ncbi:ABC transporter permease [Exiguobacterium sp. BMC-KP]|uniref:ABC transporter permease subunit n=1 Tax=Exiguobacterium sp. BMC-KP TaxID=1684312 RepID=UPI0006AA2A63|nr:ABC transporter permease subunit [Exiguobacterium sp. BMC-KP]KOP28701.1 ABC transporter permease [Exiguobacterium sp. BMC-KP]
MAFIARKSIQLIVAFFVLIAISALPALVAQMKFHPASYWEGLKQQFAQLTKLDEITYFNVAAQKQVPLLSSLHPFIQETLIIFTTAMVVSAVCAIFYAYLFYRSGRRMRTTLKQITRTLEMVPDLFWIILSQFLVIYLFKMTGYSKIEIAGTYADSIRFLPILTLTLTTLFFFIKWLTTQVLEQESAPFLELARAKGIHPAALFWKHLLPTMIYRFYLFFRANIITVLSSLLIIEYTFQVQGLFRFVLHFGQMPVLMVILFLIYLPIFIIDLLAEWLIPQAWKGGI